MLKDGVTLKKCAGDYARRCESIGNERRNIADLQDAMDHPDFKKRHHTLLDELAREHRLAKPLIERAPFLVVPVEWYKKYDSLKKLESAVTVAGNRLCDWGKDILRRMTVSGEIPESDVEFVDATNAELGYPNGCTVAQTCEAAAEFGFELCRPEDGPLARIAYTEQPMNDWRQMAMKPISVSSGSRGVFSLGRLGDGSWLCSHDGFPGRFCRGDVRWMFRRKRSS